MDNRSGRVLFERIGVARPIGPRCDIGAVEAPRWAFRPLVLTYRLTRDPQAYPHQTLNAIVARQLTDAGVRLHAGESVQYIITDTKAREPNDRVRAVELFDATCNYDVEKYAELLVRAIATILQPAGFDPAQIEQQVMRKQSQSMAWQIPLDWFRVSTGVENSSR